VLSLSCLSFFFKLSLTASGSPFLLQSDTTFPNIFSLPNYSMFPLSFSDSIGCLSFHYRALPLMDCFIFILNFRIFLFTDPNLRISIIYCRIQQENSYFASNPYNVKKAVELLDAPSKNTFLIPNTHVFFPPLCYRMRKFDIREVQ
jgi:hypothetical protein